MKASGLHLDPSLVIGILLLDVTRITQNRLELKVERIDLNSLMSTVNGGSRGAVRSKKHRSADYAQPRAPTSVNGDPVRLSQAIGNLLVNAAKLTDDGGAVTVTVSVDQIKGHAAIEIRDDCIGIEDRDLPRLFTPFTQLDKSLACRNSGLGLGLALVKGIVELHGGSVTAHSDGPGTGATFAIRLPIAQAEDIREEVAGTVEAAAGTPVRVLVIEDNADFAATMVEFLKLVGYDAMLAASGPDGLTSSSATSACLA